MDGVPESAGVVRDLVLVDSPVDCTVRSFGVGGLLSTVTVSNSSTLGG